MADFLRGSGCTIIYFIICASSALVLRLTVRVYDELFRKILHCILLGSLLVYVFAFESWWTAALSCIVFAAVVYPILKFFEHFRLYSKALTERKHGELKESLLEVFAMFAVVIAVCWGWLGDKMLVLLSVYAWGFGDAAAALIGKRFGKHKIPGSKKSWEGTFAMFSVSFVSVLTILLIMGNMSLPADVLTTFLVAAATAATELYTPGGYDTVSCPLCAMCVALPLLHFFGGGV